MIVDCPSAYVVDGDTLRCGRTRIRLLGIDAPEIESCPRWRICVAGDGQASKRSLIDAVAVVWAGGVNLSFWQLQNGQAVYKPKWDNGRLIARECR